MSLPVPKLDDRSFQQFVDEAKKRIPYYTSEWTDHNVSDPGVTLIELFAWMMETVLYRVNQVPDLHYVRFMEMLGIRLHEPIPARTLVTFWLADALKAEFSVFSGTEVASTQSEQQASVIFTTDRELQLNVPELTWVTVKNRPEPFSANQLVTLYRGTTIFSEEPIVDDAIYFGFDSDISQHVLRFHLDFDVARTRGGNPDLPPVIWEGATGEIEVVPDESVTQANRPLDELSIDWAECEIEPKSDSTRGLNQKGAVDLHLPKMERTTINGANLYWVRLRYRAIEPHEKEEGMTVYEKSPVLKGVEVETWGGAVEATHTQLFENEAMGFSDGSAGQRFQLKMAPVLKRTPKESLVVIHDEIEEVWEEVPNFSESNIKSKHYTLDSQSGELRFGPAIRQRDGEIKMYGMIPPKGASLVMRAYRTGGGIIGNVREGFLDTLKTSNPKISRPTNRVPAIGGQDGESLEAAMIRAPRMLQTRQRAVTASDFEHLAMEASENRYGQKVISRVKCLKPKLGGVNGDGAPVVYVLAIPKVHQPNRYLKIDELTMQQNQIDQIASYLDERRLLTTEIVVHPPIWVRVSAEIEVKPALGANKTELADEIVYRLVSMINPIVGGQAGTGWEFGRSLFAGDIFQCLQGVPHMNYVQSVKLYQVDSEGRRISDAKTEIEVPEMAVIVSSTHVVEFV